MSASPASTKPRPSGYDKYITFKTFAVAVGAFLLLLAIPAPRSMQDVGVEYSQGRRYVLDFQAKELFGKPHSEVEQWQAGTAEVLEAAMRQGVSSRRSLLRRDRRQLNCNNRHLRPKSPGQQD